MSNIQDTNNIPELQSPFEQLKEVDDDGKEWWNSRKLARVMGYLEWQYPQLINYHLDQIEQSGEIHLSDTIRKIRIPSDKWSGEMMMYNLDVVIAVGYRVNSYEATQFRIWATQVQKEYLIKGFVLDDERLKGKSVFGADYFDDLLNRIREIRISERCYCQKITDIYSECSSDYDKDSEMTQLFFKTV